MMTYTNGTTLAKRHEQYRRSTISPRDKTMVYYGVVPSPRFTVTSRNGETVKIPWLLCNLFGSALCHGENRIYVVMMAMDNEIGKSKLL